VAEGRALKKPRQPDRKETSGRPVSTLALQRGNMRFGGAEFPASRSSFPQFQGKRISRFRALRDGSSPRLLQSEWPNELRITLSGMRQELGKPAPFHLRRLFSPLEVFYDYDAVRSSFTRERIAQGPASMWRYSDLLPLPQNYRPTVPAGFTPLLEAPRIARKLGAQHLYLKNDAVCQPSLSFKDRVVAVALAQARNFGFDTVSCSSTGNLAKFSRGASRPQRIQGGDFHSGRSRAREDWWARRFLARSWYASREVTTRSIGCARKSPTRGTGIRQREPASLLRRRLENRRLRNRRTTRLAAARQCRGSHGGRIVDRKDQEGV